MAVQSEYYAPITTESRNRERDRLYELARHNEASALKYAREQAREEEREKWQGVIKDQEALLTDQKAEYEKRELELKKKDALIAELLTRLGVECIAR